MVANGVGALVVHWLVDEREAMAPEPTF